jgi:uncharacterized protein
VSSFTFNPTAGRSSTWAGTIIDADVRATVPSLEALYPYMDAMWIDWCRERRWRGPGSTPGQPPNSPGACRPEWRPADRVPASEPGLLREHILDPWQTEYAVLNCNYGIDAVRHPDLAAALARAVNDWIIAEWLERDSRLKASLVIPARDPVAMISEIQRVGSYPGFVQVLLPVRHSQLWGQRIFHPVFKAIVEYDLVAGLYYGGTTDGAPSSTGYTSWYIEEYTAEWQSFASQITSIVCEGVFQLFPTLRVSVIEAGFLWLPFWGWRMNKEWKGLRREVPWLDRPPLEIIRNHMRFSTAPMDAGPSEMLARCVEWLGSEDILMFSTGYPRMYEDEIDQLLSVVPETMRPKVMASAAREWYRLGSV